MIKIIKILKSNKCLLRLKLNETPGRYQSSKGEVDIIIDSAKNNYFTKTSIQKAYGRDFSPKPINSISWHGFYDNRENDVKMPVIRFKQNRELIVEHRHNGTVCQQNIFMFPICSVYIPTTFNIFSFTKERPNEITEYIILKNNKNVRVDFFVLPKNIPANEFAYLSPFIQIFYLVADISIFNKNLNGEFVDLKENPEYNLRFVTCKVLEWDVFVRFVYYEKHTREPDLCEDYSILFHDPNDTTDMLLNRKIALPNEDGALTWTSVREKHLEALNNLKKQ